MFQTQVFEIFIAICCFRIVASRLVAVEDYDSRPLAGSDANVSSLAVVVFKKTSNFFVACSGPTFHIRGFCVSLQRDERKKSRNEFVSIKSKWHDRRHLCSILDYHRQIHVDKILSELSSSLNMRVRHIYFQP